MVQTVVIPYFALSATPRLKILGVSLLERLRLAAKKCGFEEIIVLTEKEKKIELPELFFLIFPHLILSNSLWKRWRQLEPWSETVLLPEGTHSFCLIKTKHSQFVLEQLKSCPVPSGFIEEIRKKINVQNVLEKRNEWINVQDDKNIRSVEQWLLRSLVKESEGFMSKHLERKISLAITQRLAKTSISPNLMTILSTCVGLVGAGLFIFSTSRHQIMGAILFWCHSVLDGCDGEIARLKFLESRWGGVLDFWSDNMVHTAVFICIAIGLQKKYGSFHPIILGSSAVAGTLLSAAFVYWGTMRDKKGAGPLFTSVIVPNPSPSSLSALGKGREKGIVEIADFLARRDFVYLVIFLSLFGKIEWFLWLAGIGAPIYFLVLVWLAAKNK